jgi:hypothetical protein
LLCAEFLHHEVINRKLLRKVKRAAFTVASLITLKHTPSATAKLACFTLRKKSGFTSFTVASLLHLSCAKEPHSLRSLSVTFCTINPILSLFPLSPNL